MKKYAVSDLWDFVNRAETLDEIKTAIAYLEQNFRGDVDLYDDLMNSLCYKLREVYRA